MLVAIESTLMLLFTVNHSWSCGFLSPIPLYQAIHTRHVSNLRLDRSINLSSYECSYYMLRSRRAAARVGYIVGALVSVNDHFAFPGNLVLLCYTLAV